MALLTNDMFLSQLADMYMDARLGGAKSVQVTMKPYDGRMKALPKGTGLQDTENTECLVRAKRGNKKISTCVAAKDVNNFHVAYMGVLRTNMDNLGKRKMIEEKKKLQAAKAKAAKTAATKAAAAAN